MGTEMNNSTDPSNSGNPQATTVADLTLEIEAYQSKIQELSKLADIGQLSAGILHEIKNPVSFVNNFSRLSQDLVEELLESINPPPTNQEAVNNQRELLNTLSGNLLKINENGKRIERIIQGMLAQTRTDAPFLEPTDLNQLLEEYTKLAYQSVRAEDKEFNVFLHFQLDPDVGLVKISRGELGRVILNLVNNACYAVNEKRKKNLPGFEPEITVISVKEQDGILLRIIDNGMGIPADIVSKLFLPFFTTKPHGKGTGLGLALTYSSIVQTHQGKIEVTSSLGESTEFKIWLPLL